MNAGALVYAQLAAAVAVGAVAADRILPIEVDQETELPAIAYTVQLGESADGTAPLQRAVVTVHALAHAESQAHDLAVAADGALNGFAGRDGGTVLGPLSRSGWQPDYTQELNIWSVSLTYEGWATY